jgi:hypothetical protein
MFRECNESGFRRPRSLVMRSSGFILFQDGGGLWCAAPPGFRDLLHDPVGWGKTREDAVQRLLTRSDYQARAKVAGWLPEVADFAVVDMPEGADDATHLHLVRAPEPVHLHVVSSE